MPVDPLAACNEFLGQTSNRDCIVQFLALLPDEAKEAINVALGMLQTVVNIDLALKAFTDSLIGEVVEAAEEQMAIVREAIEPVTAVLGAMEQYSSLLATCDAINWMLGVPAALGSALMDDVNSVMYAEFQAKKALTYGRSLVVDAIFAQLGKRVPLEGVSDLIGSIRNCLSSASQVIAGSGYGEVPWPR